jgi:transcriptional regulator with XRE-family HTH domain
LETFQAQLEIWRNSMTSDDLTLAGLLQRALRAADLSNSQLARKVGVKPQAVDHWLNEGGKPRGELLPAIARALQLEAGDERALYRLAGYYYDYAWRQPSLAMQWPDVSAYYQPRPEVETRLREHLLAPAKAGAAVLVHGFLGHGQDRVGQCGRAGGSCPPPV